MRRVLLRFKWLFQSFKDTTLQVLLKSHENRVKQGEEQFFSEITKFINSILWKEELLHPASFCQD